MITQSVVYFSTFQELWLVAEILNPCQLMNELPIFVPVQTLWNGNGDRSRSNTRSAFSLSPRSPPDVLILYKALLMKLRATACRLLFACLSCQHSVSALRHGLPLTWKKSRNQTMPFFSVKSIWAAGIWLMRNDMEGGDLITIIHPNWVLPSQRGQGKACCCEPRLRE